MNIVAVRRYLEAFHMVLSLYLLSALTILRDMCRNPGPLSLHPVFGWATSRVLSSSEQLPPASDYINTRDAMKM